MAQAAFEAAKATRDRLDGKVRSAADLLKQFPTSGPFNLTPDHIKATPEFKAAKGAFDRAFAELRAFNSKFTIQFAADLRAERLARRHVQPESKRHA